MSELDRPTAGKDVAKRGRGRPNGSGPYRDGDLAMLARFADQLIEAPGAALAPFLAKHGYSEAAIRRAQALWRKQGRELREAAQLRFDSKPPADLFALLYSLFLTLGDIGKAVADSDVGRSLRASMHRAQARRTALKQLGQASQLPIDLENADQFNAALARFEPEMHEVGSPELSARLGKKTKADLLPSERIYVMALLLHQISLDQRQRELEAEDSLPKAVGPQSKGGGR